MSDADSFLQEKPRLSHPVKVILLKVKYLSFGFSAILLGVFLGLLRPLSTLDNSLVSLGFGFYFGFLFLLMLHSYIEKSVFKQHKEELGISNLKTLDYEGDEEITGEYPLDFLKQELKKLDLLVAILTIPAIIGMAAIYFFYMKTYGFFIIYLLAWVFIVYGITYVYIGLSGKFYLVKGFLPKD